MPVATLANLTVANITANSATLGAEITTNVDDPVIARGIVIGPTATNPDPTLGGRIVRDVVAAPGVFAVNVTDLTPRTEYSYVAYATNKSGTDFTRPVSTFTTGAQSQAEFFSGLKERALGSGDWFTRTFQAVFTIPFIAFIILCALIVVVGVFVYKNQQTDTMQFARGLITVLFATGTMAIAFVLTATAIMATDAKFEDRFGRGKEILTILIGIFGTILGFYFGTATNTPGVPTTPITPVTTSAGAATNALSEIVKPSLSTASASITLKQGGGAEVVKVTFTRGGGELSGLIHLSVIPPLKGITTVFTPNAINASETATVDLEVTATGDADVGSPLILRIIGTPDSGGAIDPLELKLTVVKAGI